MRNKWILSLIITILALPFLSSEVFAEENVVYEDGDYKITAKAVNAETGERSGAAGFIKEEAALIIQDGEATLTITVPHHEMAEITGLQIEGNEPEVTEDGTAAYMAFKLAGLKSELNAQVQYEVPTMDMKHDVPFKFILEGLDNIPVVEDEPVEPEEKPTEPEEPVESDGPSEPIEPEAPVENDSDEIENTNPALTPDEAYHINFVSESGAVNRQFNNPAALLYKDGETYIQMTGTGGQFIESLTINGKEVTWGEKNPDGTFTFQFKVLGSLSDVLDFGMVINAGPHGKMEHLVDLSFDESTQTASDNTEYTLMPESNDTEENNDSEEPADEKDPADTEAPADKEESNNNKQEDKEDPEDKKDENKEEPQKPDAKDQLVPDKAYEIDFEIKHETEDKISAADSFFKGPAILLEKDGETYIQLTVTGKQYIESLKNKFGELVVVKEDGDTIVYQFKLDGKISDVILLDMIITVPGIYEGQNHKARLFLDESSMEEIDASPYRLAASDNGNGPTAAGETGEGNQTPKPRNENGNDKTTPEKPEFGSGEDNNQSGDQKETSKKAANPQTGDTTNIMLYVLLLIGSAIPLALKLKRRFI